MVLVASETGHVYTFATQKLQPLITSEAGKALIQTCLNSPEEVINCLNPDYHEIYELLLNSKNKMNLKIKLTIHKLTKMFCKRY